MNYKDLIDKLIPLYAKHFSEQEIDDLLSFCQTSTGNKMIDKMQDILQESMDIGQKWGAEIAKKIEENMRTSEGKQYSSPPAPMRSK